MEEKQETRTAFSNISNIIGPGMFLAIVCGQFVDFVLPLYVLGLWNCFVDCDT